MYEFTCELQKFYGCSGHLFFDELCQLVNRQAIAPFFRPRLRRRGRILDAGCGSGYLANELGLRNAWFLDLAFEQVKRCREAVVSGFFIQADLEHLPFRDQSFNGVICSNVLHYTGLAGLKELLRVTKNGGQMLLTFLEDSEFTQIATCLAVWLGLFPPIMREARFIDLADLMHLDVCLKESATIAFIPLLFQASRGLPRRGLVAFELEKKES